MKYQAPFGVTDTNAGYVNGNPQTGVQGSIPPAAAIEEPQREIVNLINSSSIVPADTDLFQLAKGVRSQAMNFAVDTGATNTMVVACVPALAAYTPGLPLRVRVLHTNTGAMTLDAGAGPAPVKKMTGADPAAGDIPAGGIIEVTWDGSTWQLTNFGGVGGGGTSTTNIFSINIPYCADSGTVNAIVAPFLPAVTSLPAGWVGLVKVANSVTGTTTLQVNSFASRPVKAPDGSDLLPGDIYVGDVVEFVFDGTQFYIRPNPAIAVSCTFNVPTARFPTTDSVLAAITRKTINPTAFVTIQLASGIYSPIAIFHKDADQIIVKGTMLAGAPVYGNFATNGSGASSRANDGNNNITMLRTRYGTEVRNTTAHIGNAAQGYSCGVYNNGPGKPVIQDMLVTGDNVYPGNAPRRLVGIMGYGRNIACRNVAVWGQSDGFFALGGRVDCLDTCYACSCTISGFNAETLGHIRINRGVIAVGNGYAGIAASGTAVIYVVPPLGGVPVSYASYNGDSGVSAGLSSSVLFYGGTALGNANYDLFSSVSSAIYANNANFTYASPYPVNTEGNYGGYIGYDTAYPPGPV